MSFRAILRRTIYTRPGGARPRTTRRSGRPRDTNGESPYRLDELGWLQFEQLCAALVESETPIAEDGWSGRADELRAAVVPGGVPARRLPGPTLATVFWVRPGGSTAKAENRLRAQIEARSAKAPFRSVLLLVNRTVDPGPYESAILGPVEIGALLDARPELRRRFPFVLGVRDLDGLIGAESAGRSSLDLDAARGLARVFVPTRAYARTVAVLERHGFAVLTGPPEMGKTAIARTIGLGALTSGWEAHECIRPEQLWAAFDRDRQQLFVADDAFGSTEYRPEAAEHWALELDRVLRAMDDRHWLIWTSRPAPLKAGLRRIHREHGVEHFPQPAEVQIAASDLDVEEKALMLFRHARAAALRDWAIELVRAQGWAIVEHPHFTPERIRRFVAERLPAVARAQPRGATRAVEDEIAEPTRAMAASLAALGPEYRALLVALLDVPPGPVPERELSAAARRHVDAGLPRTPAELVDRLTDHFLRVVPPTSVTWVHPSWRDLVIEGLARDPAARRRFLARCGLDGALLALSTAGGARGERRFPLLGEDADWDVLADRLYELVRDLDDTSLFRLLAALREAAAAQAQTEAQALAAEALALLRRRWDASHAPVSVALLGAWFDLAARTASPPDPPELAPTWIELVPTGRIDLEDPAELVTLDEWTSLVAVLAERAPSALDGFGFPARQLGALEEVLDAAARAEPEGRELLARSLARIAALAGLPRARGVGRRFATVEDPQPGFPESRPPPPPERAIVARILRDLS